MSSLPQGSPCQKASKSHRLSRRTTSFPRGNLCQDATVTTVPPAPAPSSQRSDWTHLGGYLTAGTLAVDRGGVQFPGGLPGCVGGGGGGEVCLSRAVSWESQCWAHLTQARRGVDTGVAQKGTRTAGRGMWPWNTGSGLDLRMRVSRLGTGGRNGKTLRAPPRQAVRAGLGPPRPVPVSGPARSTQQDSSAAWCSQHPCPPQRVR